MKNLIVILCLLLAGCATAGNRNGMMLPPEMQEMMARDGIKLQSLTGNRNSQNYRYGSPAKGFMNVYSNRGYTTSDYHSTDGRSWSISTQNGRVTQWSINGF